MWPCAETASIDDDMARRREGQYLVVLLFQMTTSNAIRRIRGSPPNDSSDQPRRARVLCVRGYADARATGPNRVGCMAGLGRRWWTRGSN